jgi:alpha-ketoglutarate-dependent sulfate ester dioxygenase
MTVNATLDVRPVAGSLGAEIGGTQLGPHLDDATMEYLRSALLEHKVLFFRDQSHLDDAAQAQFAARLGQLTDAHPTVPGLDSEPRVLPVDSELGNRANSWHTDVTFVDRPPSFSVLRAVTLPSHGGDTVWANTEAAYQSLSQELRDLADRLWALHSNDYDYAATHSRAKLDEHTKRHLEVFTSTVYQTEHPVVHLHPETGEHTLLLGHFVKRILGLRGRDSAHLLELLQSHVTRLENTVRWRWKTDDVAIWDNRATQHYAISDYGDSPRRMHRVTVAGEVPVSVDGRHSIAREGDASAYSVNAGQ